MHRFLVSPDNIRGDLITIRDQRELHHLRHVLRLGLGHQVTCMDGRGAGYVGVIAKSAEDRLEIRIQQRLDREPAAPSLWLIQGLVKGERFEWLLQKATELGVARISPVITRHAVVKLTPPQRAAKAPRWQRIVQEASKQSGRLSVPQLDPVVDFTDAAQRLRDAAWVLMPTLAVTAIPLREVLDRLQHEAPIGPDRSVALLIGPEGDFDAEEVVLAERFGARPVSLGRLTLRSETAAVAALAMVQYALGA